MYDILKASSIFFRKRGIMKRKNTLIKRTITAILTLAIVMSSISQTSVDIYAQSSEGHIDIEDVTYVEETTEVEAVTDVDDSADIEDSTDTEYIASMEQEESSLTCEEVSGDVMEEAGEPEYEYYDMCFRENNLIEDFFECVNIEIYSELPEYGKLRPDESKVLYSGSYSSETLELESVETLKCSEHEVLYLRLSPEYADTFIPWRDGYITFDLSSRTVEGSMYSLQKAKSAEIEGYVPYVYLTLSYSDYCEFREATEDGEGLFQGAEFNSVSQFNLYSPLKLNKAALVDDKCYWKVDTNGDNTYADSAYRWNCYYSTEGSDPLEYEFVAADASVSDHNVAYTDATDGKNYDDDPDTRDKELFRGYIKPPIDFTNGNPQDCWFYFTVSRGGDVVAVSNVISSKSDVNGLSAGSCASQYKGGITLIKYREGSDEYEVLKKDEPCIVHATEDVRFGIALVSADGKTITPMDKLPDIYQDGNNINVWSQHAIYYDRDIRNGEIVRYFCLDPDEDYELNHLVKIDTGESEYACNQWYSFLEAPSYSEYESDYDGLVYITVNAKNTDKYGNYFNTFPVKVLPAEEGVEYYHYAVDESAVITSMNEFNARVRKRLLNHEEEFTLYADPGTIGDSFSLEDALDVYEERGGMKSFEGECLEGILQQCDFNINYAEDAPGVVYTFKVKYITTLEQEKQVDAWIADILSKDLKDVKDAEDSVKAKAVYDYVTNHVSGKVGANTATERRKPINHTIYTALNPNTKYGTCQAFALLFSRLCREIGVQSRVIYGTDANNHAYNIVHLKDAPEGKYWFYVDCSAKIWKSSYTEFSRATEQIRYLSDRFVLNYIRHIYQFKSDPVARVTGGDETYEGSLLLCKYYILERLRDNPGIESMTITLLKDATIGSLGELDYAQYSHELEGCNSTAHFYDHVISDYSPYVKLDMNGHKLTEKSKSDVSIRVSEVKNGSLVLLTDGCMYLNGLVPESSDPCVNGPDKYAVYQNVSINGQSVTEKVVLGGAVRLDKDCQITRTPEVDITLGNRVDCNIKGLGRLMLGSGADIGDICLNGDVETNYLQIGGFGSYYYDYRKSGNNCFNIVRANELVVKKGSILEQGTYLQIKGSCSLAGTTSIRSDAFLEAAPDGLLNPVSWRKNRYPATIQLVRSNGILAELILSGTLNEYEIGDREDYSEESEGLPALAICPVTVSGKEWPAMDLFRKGDTAATIDLTGISAERKPDGAWKSVTEKLNASNYADYIRFADVRMDESGKPDGSLIYNTNGNILVAEEIVLSDSVSIEKGETVTVSELADIEADKYKWSSSDNAVATVSLVGDKAYITGINAGNTVISALKDDVATKINVTVTDNLKSIHLKAEDEYVASSDVPAGVCLTLSPSSTRFVIPDTISVSCQDEGFTDEPGESVSGVKNAEGRYVYSYTNSPVDRIVYDPATRKLMLYRKQELDKNAEARIRISMTNEVGETIISNAVAISCYPDEKAGSAEEIAAGTASYLDLEKYGEDIAFRAVIGVDTSLGYLVLNKLQSGGLNRKYGWEFVYPDTGFSMYSGKEKAYFPVKHTNVYTGEVIYGEIPVYFTTITGYSLSKTSGGPECSAYIPFDRNKDQEGERFTIVPKLVQNSFGADAITVNGVEVEITSDDPNLSVSYVTGREFRFVPEKPGKYNVKVKFRYGDHSVMTADGKSRLSFDIPINVADVTDSGFASVDVQIKTDDGSTVANGADGYIALNKDTKYYLYDKTDYTYGINSKHKLSFAPSDKALIAIGNAEKVEGEGIRYPLTVKRSGKGFIKVIANDSVKNSIKLPIKLLYKDKSTVSVSKTTYTFNSAFTNDQQINADVFNGFEGTIKSAELIPDVRGGFDGVDIVTSVSSDVISITANNASKSVIAGKGVLRLTFDEMEEPVDIRIKVSVKNQAPDVKATLIQKGSTFVQNVPAVYKLTQSMNASISSVSIDGISSSVSEGESYYIYDADSQELALYNLTKEEGSVKYNLTVNFDDYVSRKLKIAPKVSGDELKLSTNSGTIYALSSMPLMEMRTQLIDKQKNVYALDDVNVSVMSEKPEILERYEASISDDEIIVLAKSLPSANEKLKLVLSSDEWKNDKVVDFSVKVGKVSSLKLVLKSDSVDFYNYKGKNSNARAGITIKGYNGDINELLSGVQFVSADRKSPQKDALGKYFTVRYDSYTSEIVVEKLSDRIAAGTYKVKILVKAEGLGNPLSATLTLKVKGVDTQEEIGGFITKLSVKNSIDLLNRDNTTAVITPTIKGMAKSAEYVPVSLCGEDAHLFEIVQGSGDVRKGTFKIKLKDNASIYTGRPYKISVRYRVVDGPATFYQKSPEVAIKFSQKAPKATVTMEKGVFSTNAASADKISVSLKTTGKSSVSVRAHKVEFNGNSDFVISDISSLESDGYLTVDYIPMGATIAGKSYTLSLRIVPEGSALNAKPVTVKCKVKIL